MKFAKTLIAAAMFATAGSASAAISGTSGVNNDVFLQVYDAAHVNADGTIGRTYDLDLGVTFAAVSSNAATALAAFEGAGKDLSTDANWAAFKTGLSTTGVQYYLAASDNVRSLVVSGNTAIVPNNTATTTLSGAATSVANHAVEIATGMGAASSSLIQDIPANATGQYNYQGTTAATLFTTWNYDATQAYGSATNLYWDSYHTATVTTRSGTGTVNQFTAADVHLLGQISLAGNTLTFTAPTVTAVPLPAAVWMFGAGLMGVLRATRRKSVAA